MDAFKDLWANFSTCLIEYQNHLVAGAALMAIVGRLSMEVKSLCNWIRPSEEKDAPPTNNSETNINNNGDGNAAGRDIHETHYHSNPSDLDRYIQSIESNSMGCKIGWNGRMRTRARCHLKIASCWIELTN